MKTEATSKQLTTIDYMKNCIWNIQMELEGEKSKANIAKSIRSLEHNIKKLKLENYIP